MSTTPEPMSEESLAAIDAREKAATGGPWCYGSIPGQVWFDGGHGRICSVSSKAEDLYFIAHSREDIASLVEEVRRLRDLQRAEADQLDQQAVHLKTAQDLLLERSRQAEELMSERDKAFVMNERLMEGLAQVHDYAGMSHGADWTRYYELAERTIGAIGAQELALFKARRAVAEAAKKAHLATQVANGVDIDEAQREADVAWGQVADAVEALVKLEAGR